MSGRNQRPQIVPERGLRVVLIAPRTEPDEALRATLAHVERIGWILVSMVEPDRFLDGLRMLVAGLVDRIVVAKPQYFPYVIMGADLAAFASASSIGAERVGMLPRLKETPGADPRAGVLRQRRPRLVERAGPVVSGIPDTEPQTEIAQEPAESVTPVRNSGARQRTSDRHSRTVRNQRRRRG